MGLFGATPPILGPLGQLTAAMFSKFSASHCPESTRTPPQPPRLITGGVQNSQKEEEERLRASQRPPLVSTTR